MKIHHHPSANFSDRLDGTDVRFLIMHYTACDFKTALKILTDEQSNYPVSCHYMIDEDGTTVQLVCESKRAWHAGQSGWRHYHGINTWSVGIELVNPGHHLGYCDFPNAQIKALIRLSQQIIERHSIAAEFVLGHSDVAFMRKMDPGERFPWARLARAGIGYVPHVSHVPKNLEPHYVQTLMQQFGYQIEPSNLWTPEALAALQAFQMHFSPQHLGEEIYPHMVAQLESLCHTHLHFNYYKQKRT